jgi:hypothetical protein
VKEEIRLLQLKIGELCKCIFWNLTSVPHEKIFFLDEVGFNISMRSSRGYSRKGEAASIRVPSLRSRNISICAVMNKIGMYSYKVSNYPFNSECFYGYLTEIFIGILESGLTNCIFVFDNATIHKTQNIIQLVESNGHQLIFYHRTRHF